MNEIETSLKTDTSGIPKLNSRDYVGVTNKYTNVWCQICKIYIPQGDRLWWSKCSHETICEECGIAGTAWESEARLNRSTSNIEVK